MRENNYVWTHFEKKDHEYAICKHCNLPISYKTTIANLKSHLRRKHETNETEKLEEQEAVDLELKEVDSNSEYEILEETIWKDDSEEEVWEPVISESDESDEEGFEGKKKGVSITTELSRVKGKKGSSRTKQRPVWAHFDKIDDDFAICKYCSGKFSYKSSTGNLNSHLRKKHSFVYLIGEEKTTNDSVVQEHGNSAIETIEKVYGMTETQKTPRKRGRMWAHFNKINEAFACCKYCNAKLSYKSTTGNLSIHIKKVHPSIELGQTDSNEVANNDSDHLLEDIKSRRASVISSERHLCDESTDQANSLTPRGQPGRIWTYFTKIDSEFASCKQCKQSRLSYKSSIGHLSLHLKRVHPSTYLAYANDDEVTIDNSNDMLSPNEIKKEMSMASTSIEDSTYDEIIERTSSKSSLIWKHFYKMDNECAICKYCNVTISYKTPNAELKTHLRKSHTSIYMAEQFDTDKTFSNNKNNQITTGDSDQNTTDYYGNEDIMNNGSDEDIDENMVMKTKTKDDTLDFSAQSDEMIQVSEETRSKTGQIWRHFDKINDKIACCKYCKKNLSYRSSTGNLNSHLRKIHTQVYLEQRNDSDQVIKTIKKEIWMVPTSNAELTYNKPEPRKSEIWTHFDKVDNTYARCKYCQINFSYKTTTGNLTVHLRKAHASIYMAHRINYDSNIVWICNDSDQAEKKDEPQPKRRKTIENKVIAKQTREEHSRVERDLLGLFIYDYQPLGIMEDKGFATFINRISRYPLPSMKKILKTIPVLYEKTLSELKQILARDAISVCLTTECWTSSLKNTYIAVTAHYTDISFERRMILLECTCLNEGRTSEMLAQKIKTIIEKWELNTKVVFAIADNSKNIEHAIENLGWNGYGCYSHILNLIFLHALKPMEQLIENINKVIMYFKSSATAQEMLASYQCRNALEDDEPKDLIQQVPEHWNGTFLMLRRFIQLNEAIQYCMALSDSEWPVFSEEEWELASQLYEVLETFDEVTSSMLGDQYMSGSLVIIITNCLKTMCEDFLEKDEYEHYKPEIKELISFVDSHLKERFSMIEYNKDFALCTLLDPRFKCYGFHDDTAFADIKEYLLKLLIELMDSNEPNPVTEDNAEKNKDVSAWDRFDKILRQKKPRANSSVKAERELQMYLDDDMMPRQNQDGQWNHPAQWWREHKIIYPNLSEIYRTRCNIVATSVPWDRLYSKKGQMLSKRRSNLEAGEVEKLVFLNANLEEKRFDDIFKEIETKIS